MIAFFAVIAFIVVLIMVVPAIAAAVARNVVSTMDRRSASSIDQSMVEARLGRIEEAIDAMALQIERLSEHQRALLGPSSASSQEEEGRSRTELPR